MMMLTLTRMMATMTMLPAGARPAAAIAAFLFVMTRGGGAEQNIRLRQPELPEVAV